jgi:hypothetical protein
MCNRVLWLEHGRVAGEGPAAAVVDEYVKKVAPHLTAVPPPPNIANAGTAAA